MTGPLSVTDNRKNFCNHDGEKWRIEKMTEAGVYGFVSTLANGMPLVDARYKVFLKNLLSSLRIKIL